MNPARSRRRRCAGAALLAAALIPVAPVLLHLSQQELTQRHRTQQHAQPTVAQIAPDTVVARTGSGAVSATATGAVAHPPITIGTAVRPATPPAWRTIVVNGSTRRYLLAAPPGNEPHPLLVLLHGLNEHTDTFFGTTQIVQAALAAGVAVAGPETPDGAWNDGRFGSRGRDDDAYIMAIVDQLVQQRVAATGRVTLAGFSNGAGMSVELTSRHPGRFAGLVLVGEELLAGRGMPRPASGVPTVLVHGTDDHIQPWSGRTRRSPRMPAQVGVPATLAAFIATAGAGAPQPMQTLPHVAGHVAVTVQHWVGTSSVALYRLVGAGHVWPVSVCPPTSCRPTVNVARLADVSATMLAVQAALADPAAAP